MEKRKQLVSVNRLLLSISLLLATFVVLSVYGMAFAEKLSLLSVLLAPVWILALFSPLFAGAGWFFAVLALTLLLAVAALFLVKPGRAVRLYLLVATALLIAAPLLLPLLYGPYTHYVETVEGVEMFWPTQPADPFATAFKNAQRVHEKYGCTYHLLGWSEDDVLYYVSACDGHIWLFDPAVGHIARPALNVPPEVRETLVQGAGNVRTYPPQPAGFLRHVRNHVLTYETALSPSGQWEAAAIKNYYGPRDVVVVSR